MTSIAQLSDLRPPNGPLLLEDLGGASDSQVGEALTIAQTHLIELVSRATYISVRDNSTTEAQLEKQEAFRNAEKYFTISFLPRVVTTAQLDKTGFKTSSSIGQAVTSFGNIDKMDDLSDWWATQAMTALAPYIDHSFIDDNDSVEGEDYDDGSISLTAI